MARGRCAGCGYENSTSKVVANHITKCGMFLDLFIEDPDKAIAPEKEYVRHKEWKTTASADELKLKREQDRAAEFRRNAEAIHARQRERWNSKPVPLITEERVTKS